MTSRSMPAGAGRARSTGAATGSPRPPRELAHLGFVLRDGSRPGTVPGPRLLVALRDRPTLEHFDPEEVDVLGGARRPGPASRPLDRRRRLPVERPFSWGRIRRHRPDPGEQPVPRRSAGRCCGARSRRRRASSSRSPRRRRSSAGPGHSQGVDPLVDEIGAFFARLMVPRGLPAGGRGADRGGRPGGAVRAVPGHSRRAPAHEPAAPRRGPGHCRLAGARGLPAGARGTGSTGARARACSAGWSWGRRPRVSPDGPAVRGRGPGRGPVNGQTRLGEPGPARPHRWPPGLLEQAVRREERLRDVRDVLLVHRRPDAELRRASSVVELRRARRSGASGTPPCRDLGEEVVPHERRDVLGRLGLLVVLERRTNPYCAIAGCVEHSQPKSTPLLSRAWRSARRTRRAPRAASADT